MAMTTTAMRVVSRLLVVTATMTTMAEVRWLLLACHDSNNDEACSLVVTATRTTMVAVRVDVSLLALARL